MVKRVYLLLTILIVLLFLSSCNKVDVTLELDKTNYNIEIGSTWDLKLLVKPTNLKEKPIIEWSSSDSSVATVNTSGQVKGVSPGTAIVTAKIKNQETTVTTNINVIPIYSLNKQILNIEKDSSDKLEVTVNPSGYKEKLELEWSTSDITVATVDKNGLITGVSEGEAVIILRINGSNQKLESRVKVSPKLVKGIKIIQEEITLIKDSSAKLEVILTPNDAKNKKIFWVSDDPKIVRVDNNGVIQAIKVGKTFVTVKTDDGGYDDNISITVNEKPVKKESKKESSPKSNSTNQSNKTEEKQEIRIAVEQGMIHLFLNKEERLSFQSRVYFNPQPLQYIISIRPSYAVNGKLSPPQPHQNYDFKAVFNPGGKEAVVKGKTDFKDYAVPVPHGLNRECGVSVDIYVTYKGKVYKFSDKLYY